jgi:hypothetical protein
MSADNYGGLRKSAAHAVTLARQTSDHNVRAALLELAQRLAAQEAAQTQAERLNGALLEFNHRQLFGSYRPSGGDTR